MKRSILKMNLAVNFSVILFSTLLISCVSEKTDSNLKEQNIPPLKRDAPGACLVEDVEGEYQAVRIACTEGKKPSKVNYDIAPDKYFVRKGKLGLGIVEIHFKKPESKRESFSLAFPNAAPAAGLQETGIQCDSTKSGDLRLFQVLNCGLNTKCSHAFARKGGKFVSSASVFHESSSTACTIQLKKVK